MTTAATLRKGDRVKAPQAGVEALVYGFGWASHWEDDDEFGRVTVKTPVVKYTLYVDGVKLGNHALSVADFCERFALGDPMRTPTAHPWN